MGCARPVRLTQIRQNTIELLEEESLEKYLDCLCFFSPIIILSRSFIMRLLLGVVVLVALQMMIIVSSHYLTRNYNNSTHFSV